MSTLTSVTEVGSAIAPSLEPWLSGEDGEARSLIVEVKLPQRRVAFERGSPGKSAFPRRLVGNDSEGRRLAIRNLADFLEHEVGLRARVLEAAGAIAVSATPDQVRRLLKHPLTKGVQPNRSLVISQ